jgi:hypothetical protein
MSAPVAAPAQTRTKKTAPAAARGAAPVAEEKPDKIHAAPGTQYARSALPANPASIPVDPPEEKLPSPPAIEAARLVHCKANGSGFDPLEAEANAMAERATIDAPAKLPASTAGTERRLEDDSHQGAAAPPWVREALRSPSQPLDSAARSQMEASFGWSFANLHIHTGAAAAQSAAMLNAQAYTVGRHIVFAQGKLRTDSLDGRRLLAHELTHVTRQAEGVGRGRVQAQSDKPPKPPKAINFKLKVTHTMGPDELLKEFIRQYYRETDEQEVARKVPLWHWTGKEISATENDVKRKYLILPVTDAAEIAFAAKPKDEQKKINEETDERFWEQTGYKPGQKLGNSPQDQEMGRQWMGVRADIMVENAQSDAINALRPDIKEILFAGDRKLAPSDYGKVLELADKLGRLTPAQRHDYLSKVNADTTSLSDMDASIDRYILSQTVEEAEEEKTDEAAAKLFGLEDLYKLWKAKRAADAANHGQPRRGGGFGPPPAAATEAAVEANAKFTAALKQNHFDSAQAFVDAMEAYRLRFQAEAVHLAMEIMARYEHKLFLERKKFQNPANAAALVQNIAGTQAKAHYDEASSKQTSATLTRVTAPDDMAGALQAGRDAAELEEQSKKLKGQAEGEVVGASGNDAIVDPEQLGRGTDREQLAGLDAAGAQQYLLKTIDERYADLGKARGEFTEDPERIFSQHDLVAATLKSQQIGDDTIYAWIIHDYIADQQMKHLFSAIAVGILAFILAALVPGGGWVAAAALLTSAAISTAQAIEAVQEYNKQGVDYRLNFIEDEPSLVWVAVAVAGAALDLGMTTTQLLKIAGTAKALKELEPALKEFSAVNSAETAAARLETLRAKIEAVEGLQTEVKEALEAKAAAEVGLSKAIGKAGGMTMASLGGAVDPTPVFEALYYGIKKGAKSIIKLRGETKILELMGDVTKLSEASREELTTAFERVKEIIKIGKSKGMDDALVLKYVDRLAEQRSGGEGVFDVVTGEMNAWKKPTAAQLQAESALAQAHGEVAGLKQERDALLAELRGGPKTADGKPDLDRIAEIREQLEGSRDANGKLVSAGLDDQIGIDRQGRKYVQREGEISKAERVASEAERAADRAKVDPKKLMRGAFGGSQERADVIAGVTKDQVGVLKTPATRLTVDHIVSINQISEMEGFEKLTLAERKQLATLKDNLIVMDGSANSSKGERSWAEWKQSSAFYDPATKDTMMAKESELRKQIQDWIQDKVKNR